MIRRVAPGFTPHAPRFALHRQDRTHRPGRIDPVGRPRSRAAILHAGVVGESGRWSRYEQEQILFHLKDRKEGEYCLAPTAEEPCDDGAFGRDVVPGSFR